MACTLSWWTNNILSDLPCSVTPLEDISTWWGWQCKRPPRWSGSLPRATGGSCVAWPFCLLQSVFCSEHSPGHWCKFSPRVALEKFFWQAPLSSRQARSVAMDHVPQNNFGPHCHQIQGELQHWSISSVVWGWGSTRRVRWVCGRPLFWSSTTWSK